MTPWSLEDAIAIAGGPVTVDTCPEVIPLDQLREILQTFHQTSDHFHGILERAGVDSGGALALTHSPAFSCTVRPVQGGHYAILVPLGMPARARVAARLLLRHWAVGKVPRFIRSPVDKIDDDPGGIPPLLRPLFLETLAPDEFWQALLKLDQAIELDPKFEPDVRELVHLALVYFLAHEFTHTLHGHFDVMAQARAGACKMETGRLHRGLEVDADAGAAAITMLILNDDVVRASAAGQEARMETGWLRLGYAVTMLFAITDAVRKHFPGYEEGAYNHPMVRCELFFAAAERALAEPEEVKALWRETSGEGWLRCVKALEMLNFEAYSRDFGDLPAGKRTAPLHALLYGAVPMGPSDRALHAEVLEAARLMSEVRTLLPIFQRGQG